MSAAMVARTLSLGRASRAARAPVRIGEIVRTFAVALALAFGVRTFVYEPFGIPTGSMMPTLDPGDLVFAAKLPVWVGAAPERGDVLVFRGSGGGVFVKRVIGLPGDRVAMRGGVLWLNGRPVARRVSGEQLVETLPSGRSYATLDAGPFAPGDSMAELAVPGGHYFMLGDDRDRSADSRFLVANGGLGFVPAADLIGRAAVVFWPVGRIGAIR